MPIRTISDIREVSLVYEQADAKSLRCGFRCRCAEPMPGDERITYDFDPHHPVPSAGGTITSGEPVMRGGAYDQREGLRFFGSREPYVPLAARPDVLVFETASLAEDVGESRT